MGNVCREPLDVSVPLHGPTASQLTVFSVVHVMVNGLYAITVLWLLVTAMRGGGGTTDTDAKADCPSTVTVIVALPIATAVTNPASDTAATLGALLVHETRRPVKMLPELSCGVATSCIVSPTMIETVEDSRRTDATWLGFTEIVAVPDFPSLVAVMTTGRVSAPA